MPYRDKEKQKNAMRRIMRKHREKKRQSKKQAKTELLKLITKHPQLRKEIPSVLDVVLGRRRKRNG